MDMDYISVPIPVFDKGIKATFEQIFDKQFVDCQSRKCAILRTCKDTMDIIDSWLQASRQKRFKFEMENGVNYYIPVTSLFRQRLKNQRI